MEKTPDQIAKDEIKGSIDDTSEFLRKIGQRFVKMSSNGLSEIINNIINKNSAKLKDKVD